MKNKIISRDSIETVTTIDSEIQEISFLQYVDSTLNKWLNLQKILKESQSLEKIIEKQLSENIVQMKNYIQNFYELKIKSRKIYEGIKKLKMRAEGINVSNENEFYITESSGAYFSSATNPMENLFCIIRDYFDYIPKIISLIDENDTKEEIESLAEFICNQLYTNILISNPEQEELLICMYKLLEQEINNMDFADIDTFLDDSTFVGKLMTAFSKQQELNYFLVNLLGNVLNEVGKRSHLMEISISEIFKFIKDNSQKEKETKKYDDLSEKEYTKKILRKIPSSKINFKKQKELEEEILKDTTMSTSYLSKSLYEDDEMVFDETEQYERKTYNPEYLDELTKQKLLEKIKTLTDKDLISFYNHLINQLNENYHNPNAFNNRIFFWVLNQEYFKSEKEKILKIYIRNFLFIQEQIENIIQSLIDKITTIPYSVRCICKIIDILITKKFPSLPKYFRHSFIGKFLFNKCIFPILSLENPYGLKDMIIIKTQLRCLKCIVSILSNANKCKLFDIYNDIEKTMFNYYLLEIIPILNKFYNKLVDIKLPNQLNEFMEKSSKNDSKITFLFNSEENTTPGNINLPKKEIYDYFNENPDEIIRIKSVCFNESDIIFILKLLNKNINLFQNLPKFDKVKRAIKEKSMKELEDLIYSQKEKRKEKKLDNTKGEGYYMYFYIEENRQKLINHQNENNKKKEKTLLSRIETSIKTILRRINLLNVKQYSYLNFATSNDKFFQAINCTLKDFEGRDNEIPLSWHSKFIINNKNQLEQIYLENDYEKLYQKIYKEENDYLNQLRSISPIINARETMNLNCAENAIENMEYNIRNLEKAKKLEKIKIFITEDQTEICVSLDTKSFQKAKTEKNSKLEEKTNNYAKIKIIPKDKCLHNVDKFISASMGHKIKNIDSHIKSVNEFIVKIRKSKGISFAKLSEFIKEDITNRKAKHEINETIGEYKDILKRSLRKNYKNLIENEQEHEEIIDKIEDFILQKIYRYVFPKDPLPEDMVFHGLTKSYDWIPSTYFGVKVDLPYEAIKDSIFYIMEMEEKAFSVSEKIKCLKAVYDNINKINEFYCDKADKSAEAQTPIFIYIILKSHPKRFISNINYINCFTKKNQEGIEFFKTNCEVALEKISSITPSSLNMTVEEFNERNSGGRVSRILL